MFYDNISFHICDDIDATWSPFHKAFFQWQMTKISDKSADNQSEARISVAYNKNCHLSLMTSFVKLPHDLTLELVMLSCYTP